MVMGHHDYTWRGDDAASLLIINQVYLMLWWWIEDWKESGSGWWCWGFPNGSPAAKITRFDEKKTLPSANDYQVISAGEREREREEETRNTLPVLREETPKGRTASLNNSSFRHFPFRHKDFTGKQHLTFHNFHPLIISDFATLQWNGSLFRLRSLSELKFLK